MQPRTQPAARLGHTAMRLLANGIVIATALAASACGNDANNPLDLPVGQQPHITRRGGTAVAAADHHHLRTCRHAGPRAAGRERERGAAAEQEVAPLHGATRGSDET